MIKINDLSDTLVKELVKEHLNNMAVHSLPESRHALDATELIKPDISFYCAREGIHLAGCGALRELDDTHGEIKSMKTADHYLRKGVGKQILTHLINEAEKRSYSRLSLTTYNRTAFS
ncbi:GNAT family N-acetyltransferase [Halobacillus salinarum]|uniref:GNAT family N-acetyltransferase n=1 Tax=Halobacillus salinarum TaxID=2932257 RepID=A0ABY4EG65_9BACI|nr:GNAT family N-acetyltransferase [Halobacillus salinarum]UOQ42888.1 GNAT family N-acetyltransferase [Halobacillus salinarum]